VKPQWEAQIGILNNALQQLEELYPKLPATFTIQGVTISVRDELITSLTEIIGIVNVVASSEDIDPILLATHQQNIVNICNQIPQAIGNLISNPQTYLEQLASHIWSIRSSIMWLIKPNHLKLYFNLITNTDLIGKIESTDLLYKRLLDSVDQIKQSINLARESDETVNGLLKKIEGYEREAANAKTNAESSSSLALACKESIQELLSKLETAQIQQQTLFEKINVLREEAALVLEGNSKAGLAASFANRRVSLEKSQQYWVVGFFIGIVVLIIGIFLTTTGLINLTPLIKADGTIDAWSVIARILLTGPTVWFTWFVARQYAHTMRLIEDYAFKEASALAFVSYKREMGEDEEMIKLLREIAIKNFGSPPTRMLSVSEPLSPLHELVDKALQNEGGLEKVTEFLKTLISRKNT